MIRKSLLLVGLCLAVRGMAADFTTLSLTGFNADCIYQSGENMGNHTSLDGGNWIYYSRSHKSEGGLDQEFKSRRGVPYKLAGFNGNNALLLHENGKGSDLVFQNQTKATELFVLGMQAGGYQKVKVWVQYTDNTETYQELEFPDWYNNEAGSAIFGMGRMDLTNGNFDGSRNFGLYEKIILVDGNKTLKKMWCEAGNNGYAAIFAVTASNGYADVGNNPLFMITNSHMDTQWNWDVKTTIDQYIKSTLDDNFARLDKYDKFRFNFEGAQKYQWMKEYYPDKYERLKGYVAQGRWNPSGCGWDANEVMVSSAESLLRNLLYGQTFYKHEFNKKGGLDIMLPDCFGFPSTLPTIAAHCGCIGFHTAKLAWGSAYNYNDLPSFGKWRGIDGSELYCILKPGAYDSRFKENLANSGQQFNNIDWNDQNLGLRAAFQYTGKMGDRGGALDDEEVRWLQESVNTTNGRVNVKLATPTEAFEFMQSHDNGQYKIVDHELPMRTHGVGCYTSQTWMKYWNRRNELTADAAERTAVAADWLGTKTYPYKTLTEAWQRVIWHQFHDDLTGTSIPRAYGYSRNDEALSLLDFRTARDGSVAAVAERMDTRVSNTPVVVYNPLSIDREDIVEVNVPATVAWRNVRVTDGDGKETPAQLTKFADGRQYFIFVAKVPSLGYATYSYEKNGSCSYEPKNFSISGNTMENSKYRVTIDQATGDIKSLYDKTLNQDIFNGGLRLALIECRSTTWPSWEIPWSETRKQSNYVGTSDGAPAISIVEDGPLRKSFRIVRKREGSTFVQYVRLTSAGTNERVDVENEVDWQSRGRMLKLEANLTGRNGQATYDTSLGYLSRGNSAEWYYEFCGHQWADQTSNDGRYGLSILNDCKYGWDKPDDGKLRMTLIYTPIVDNNYRYEGNQDMGYNQFRFSLYSHANKVNEQTRWQSDRLNQPLVAYTTSAHDGSLGKQFSFAKVNNDKVAIRALKRAEDSDVYIIRFHELVGNQQQGVQVTFPTEITSASEVNGLEEQIKNASFSGKTLTFDISKFSVKTFAVKLKAADKVNKNESVTVNLDYNADMYSRNDDKNNGEGNVWLFPGELIGQQISHENINFKMGSSNRGDKNVVKCDGRTINLPNIPNATNSNKTIHVLAFTTKPLGSKVEFDVNGQKTPVEVAYYRGNLADADGYFGVGTVRKDNVALIGTHSHRDNKDNQYDYLYIYHYKIQAPQGSNSLRIPNQGETYIAAISLEDGPAYPFNSIQNENYLFPCAEDVAIDARPRDTWLRPDYVTASQWTNGNEAPEFAADGDSFTKWCAAEQNKEKWIEYDFNEEVEVRQWELLSGAFEQNGDWNDKHDYVTAAARLQYQDENGNWQELDAFQNNKENHITRSVGHVISKKFRVYIDKPQQNDGGAARIYQLNFYGEYRSVIRERWLKPNSVTASNFTNNEERPELAADGKATTKWCDNTSNPKWIEYNFNEPVDIKKWEVYSAGAAESPEYITSAMTLQYYDEASGTYREVDSFRDNHDNRVVREIPQITAKKFRVIVNQAEQNGDNAARVYQLNLYGEYHSLGINWQAYVPTLQDGEKPVYDLNGRAVGTANVHNGVVNLPQLPSGIYVVSGKKIRVSK